MAKTAPINMRVEPAMQTLLSRAARAANKDRSAFILEAARTEAEKVLLDQCLFQLDGEQFAAFEAALDEPLPDDTKLKALLAKDYPWE